jgi:phage tail tape-measure protein
MDARVEAQAGFEVPAVGDGSGPGLAHDPLRQLETELQATAGTRPDGLQAYEEAQALLDQAWSIFMECRVMREGLQEACREIEEAMDSIQKRFGSPQTPVEPNSREHPINGTQR